MFEKGVTVCKLIIFIMDSRYEHTMLLVDAIATNNLDEVNSVIQTKRHIDLQLESSFFYRYYNHFPEVDMRFTYNSDPYIRRPKTVLGCAMLKGLPMFMHVYRLYTYHVRQKKISSYTQKTHVEYDFDMMVRYAELDLFKKITSHCWGNSYVMNYADCVHQLFASIIFSKEEEQHNMAQDGLFQYRRLQLAKLVIVKLYEMELDNDLIEMVSSVPQLKSDGSTVMFGNILEIFEKRFGELIKTRKTIYIDALNFIAEDKD